MFSKIHLPEGAMTGGELAFLSFILGAFLIFMGALAGVTWWSRK